MSHICGYHGCEHRILQPGQCGDRLCPKNAEQHGNHELIAQTPHTANHALELTADSLTTPEPQTGPEHLTDITERLLDHWDFDQSAKGTTTALIGVRAVRRELANHRERLVAHLSTLIECGMPIHTSLGELVLTKATPQKLYDDNALWKECINHIITTHGPTPTGEQIVEEVRAWVKTPAWTSSALAAINIDRASHCETLYKGTEISIITDRPLPDTETAFLEEYAAALTPTDNVVTLAENILAIDRERTLLATHETRCSDVLKTICDTGVQLVINDKTGTTTTVRSRVSTDIRSVQHDAIWNEVADRINGHDLPAIIDTLRILNVSNQGWRQKTLETHHLEAHAQNAPQRYRAKVVAQEQTEAHSAA